MNLQSLLGLALAGLSLVFTVVFFTHQPVPKDSGPDIPMAPTSYTELMPASSGESYRIHVRDNDGFESEVRIKYVDGTDGILSLSKNSKVLLERRFFADGTTRKEAHFDEAGLLKGGFESRIDKSLLWQVVRSNQYEVVTNSYWPSGKLFMERTIDLERKRTSQTIYRKDGMLWQENLVNAANILLEQRHYDEKGRLRVTYSIVGNESDNPYIQVLYLDENGDLDFDQRISYAADYYYDATLGERNPNRLVIKSIGVYNQSKLQSRVYTLPSGRIHTIEEFFPDGSVKRSHVQGQNNITQIETESSGGGRTTRFDFEGKFGKAPTIDKRHLVPLPDGDAPFRQFDASEKEFHDAQ